MRLRRGADCGVRLKRAGFGLSSARRWSRWRVGWGDGVALLPTLAVLCRLHQISAMTSSEFATCELSSQDLAFAKGGGAPHEGF